MTFNATAVSVNWPEKIPAPDGLKIHLSASGQTMQAVGGEFQNFVTFNYAVHADGSGQFVIATVASTFVSTFNDGSARPMAFVMCGCALLSAATLRTLRGETRASAG